MLPWRQWPSQLTEKTQVETGKRTWLDCQNLVGVGIGIWRCLHSLYGIVQFSMYNVYCIYAHIYIYTVQIWSINTKYITIYCFANRMFSFLLLFVPTWCMFRGSTPSRGRQHWGGTQMNVMPKYVVYNMYIYIHILWYIINNGFHWIKLLGSSLLQEIFWSQLCFAIWGYQCNQVREYITIHGLSRSMKDNGTKCTIVQTCQMLWCLTCYT